MVTAASLAMTLAASACARATPSPAPFAAPLAAPGSDGSAPPSAIPGVPNRPDLVTVVPFYEKPGQTPAERLQVGIAAQVDGVHGVFLVDLGDPDLDLNRRYMQPSPSGGVDTVTEANRLPDSTRGDDPKAWNKVHVTLQIGTFRIEPADPDINTASDPHRFNATLDHAYNNFGGPTGPLPFFAPRLGDIGLCVLEPFETIFDFRHRRLVLIRLDSAGRRLAAVPAYTPRWSAPLRDIARKADYYGVQHWWGLAVRPDNTLDTRTPSKNTVIRQFSPVPWAYWYYLEHPEALPSSDLGYPFLRQFGVVGFNPRTHQFILYR